MSNLHSKCIQRNVGQERRDNGEDLTYVYPGSGRCPGVEGFPSTGTGVDAGARSLDKSVWIAPVHGGASITRL